MLPSFVVVPATVVVVVVVVAAVVVVIAAVVVVVAASIVVLLLSSLSLLIVAKALLPLAEGWVCREVGSEPDRCKCKWRRRVGESDRGTRREEGRREAKRERWKFVGGAMQGGDAEKWYKNEAASRKLHDQLSSTKSSASLLHIHLLLHSSNLRKKKNWYV